MVKKLITLIPKYDYPGPRYTSYPPAPLFTSSFGPDEYLRAIQRTEAESPAAGLSLYFHFPFCDTLCYFCGCNTIVTRNRHLIDTYLERLMKEVDLLAEQLSPQRQVVQMHWGGGTPTYLSPSQIEHTGEYIRNTFSFHPDAEVSVESDPRDVTFAHLRALRVTGFQRISLGVQDLDPRVQQAVNRNQSEFQTRQVIEWGRELGFSSLNIDLIYGLPLQTVESFTRTLKSIIDIGPERIALYNLAFVPWMKKHQKLIHVEDLPQPDTKMRILATAIERLSNAGYCYIGMDHFARPDDELTIAQRGGTLHRNFQGYSTRAGYNLYGLGLSAIGHFGPYYAQNAKTLPEYFEAIDNRSFATKVGYVMTRDDEIRKHVILRLMCNLHLTKTEVEKRFQIEFDSYFADSLKKLMPLCKDGLVVLSRDSLDVTEIGRLFLRNIAMCFDAYLPHVPVAKPVYSRTV